MAVEVGTKAPDFTLTDSNMQKVVLSSFQGDKNVLLVFYPFAFSRICTGELCQLRDELPDYTNANVQILGISVDSPYALKAWATQENFNFPLLSDFWPHGAVATTYGVFNDKAGLATRGTFLIDPTGTVRFTEVNAPGDPRNQETWKKAITTL
jgi:peroxiredoxin